MGERGQKAYLLGPLVELASDLDPGLRLAESSLWNFVLLFYNLRQWTKSKRTILDTITIFHYGVKTNLDLVSIILWTDYKIHPESKNNVHTKGLEMVYRCVVRSAMFLSHWTILLSDSETQMSLPHISVITFPMSYVQVWRY
jgi:hypothetical protein